MSPKQPDTSNNEWTFVKIGMTTQLKQRLQEAANFSHEELEEFIRFAARERVEFVENKKQQLPQKDWTLMGSTYIDLPSDQSFLPSSLQDISPEQICEIRLRRGLTQEQFASILGVHPMTVSVWEVGKKKPSKRMLAKIREFCFYSEEVAENQKSSLLFKRFEELSLEEQERFIAEAQQHMKYHQGQKETEAMA